MNEISRRPSRGLPSPTGLARIYLARDVVECPECGEPEPFLGVFLRQGRGEAVRLWRLEWITSAPAGFARWAGGISHRWRRAREIFVNHCGSCGTPLADPLGFRSGGGWLCDSGIEVAVSFARETLIVSGFSPGAVVLPGGPDMWDEALRMTPRDFRRRFREVPRFAAMARSGRRFWLSPAPAPHRWRLLERDRRDGSVPLDETFFTFSQAREAAAVRFGVPIEAWRAETFSGG
jgi:hypothetical protein